MKDDIKIDNGRYVCTTYLYPGITRVSRSALENFLFLKSLFLTLPKLILTQLNYI